MRDDLLTTLRRLSDAELVAQLRDIAGRERGAVVLLVAHLAELDTRDVHLRAGYGSLFAYCREVLALSEQEAYNRIAVARAARRFPVVLAMLEEGALNLTNARLLAPHLTAENHREVLDAARGKNKLQVEEIAARLWPRPDAPTIVRRVPSTRTLTAPAAAASAPVHCSSAGAYPLGSPAGGPVPLGIPDMGTLSSAALPPARPPADVTVLSPDRYRVQVTIGGDTLEKLRLAKDLLRHAVPSGDEAAILDRALTALLADLAQRKFAAADKPRASGEATPGSRHIPAEVKRAVWLRDLGRCAFVGTGGRRCAERAFVEFHHIHPHGLGGPATVRNIQLRCRAHNEYEAKIVYGHSRARDGHGLVREKPVAYRAAVGGMRGGELVPERVRAPQHQGASP